MVMSGVTDLVLAWLMISGWPGTAIGALGLIGGVNLMTSGLAITMAALAGRSLVKGVQARRADGVLTVGAGAGG